MLEGPRVQDVAHVSLDRIRAQDEAKQRHQERPRELLTATWFENTHSAYIVFDPPDPIRPELVPTVWISGRLETSQLRAIAEVLETAASR